VAALVAALSGLTTPLKPFTAEAQYIASATTSDRPTKPSKPSGQGLDTDVLWCTRTLTLFVFFYLFFLI